MKNRELIKLLLEYDMDTDVTMEGCDCHGVIEGVVTLEDYFSKGKYAENHKGDRDIIITKVEDCES